MSITLRHNERLELNLVEYGGAVSLGELKALAAFSARNPDTLQVDCLNVIMPGANFSQVDLAALDALFGRYRTLFAPLQFPIFRRSAWLCLSSGAQQHLHYWLGGRNTRDELSTTTRQFESYAEACDWLLLRPADVERIERREGFAELARYELPAAPVR